MNTIWVFHQCVPVPVHTAAVLRSAWHIFRHFSQNCAKQLLALSSWWLVDLHHSITLVDFQLDAQNSYLFIYNTFIKILYMFRALPCSSSGGLCHNCIQAASGIVTLCRWLSCALVKNAKQARQIHQYKKIKIKLYKNNTAIWYNKTCRIKQLIPTYINIRINSNNPRCQSSFFLNRCTGQSPAESDDTRDCMYTVTM